MAKATVRGNSRAGAPQLQPVGFEGHVDFYGHHAGAGGWFVGGWLSHPWPPGRQPSRAVATFAGLSATDPNTVADDHAGSVFYHREDVSGRGIGFIFFLRSLPAAGGALRSLSVSTGPDRPVLQPTPGVQRLSDGQLGAHVLALLGRADGPDARQMRGQLADAEPAPASTGPSRQPYRGEDTLAGLAGAILLEFDDVIQAGQTGLILIGWLLAHPGEIAEIRVCSGEKRSVLDLAACVRINRQDVLESFAEQGFADPDCGFIAYLPDAVTPGCDPYLEVETRRGEVGYRTVPRPKWAGIAAIKRLLSAVDVRFGDVPSAFGGVLGPAVADLNTARLAVRPSVQVVQYGVAPPHPRCSVIIPLYGRLDYVEYQLALFSAHPGAAEVELIYVLDEPARRREAQYLFTSVRERFALPFKAVLLSDNVGFAPASNIGLRHATGDFVAFLNSDVFPGTPDWLEQLTQRLECDPGIGVIGPMLLFEDGSVQHRGMVFQRLPEFGDLYFGIHHDKGMRPPRSREAQTQISITGACMVMRRALATRLEGFDEAFVIGDFEDSDLCFRAQELGYRCVVDTSVELYHLERKSQASSGLGWRMNLTVYNAWQHDRRWGRVIAAQQG